MGLKPEGKALFWIITVLGAFVFAVIYTGKKNLWFEPSHVFFTVVDDAEALTPGSLVTLAGLRVGEVENLEVDDDNRIRIRFTVRSSLAHKIRRDATAVISRPFLIGEKRIRVLPGSSVQPVLPHLGSMQGRESVAVTDIISGHKVEDFLARMDGFLSRMDAILAGINPKDVEAVAGRLSPTLDSVHRLTRILEKDLRGGLLKKTMTGVEGVTGPLARRRRLMVSLVNNLEVISKEMESNKAFASQVTRALRELIVTLKAVQKTWLLSDHVEELREEEDSGRRGRKVRGDDDE